MSRAGHIKRRAARNPYGELIHELNQRYHGEWVRAQALESELARMKGYMLWPVIDWLRKVKRWFRGKRSTQPLLAEQSVPYLACAQTSEPAGKVSIIIPFKDHVELLRNCLRSLTIATYRDFEVILVNNGSTESRTRRYLTRIATVKKIRVVDSPGTFNFAHLCNAGAALASGDHLVFLNNDTEVVSPNWLQELLGITSDPKVGIAGATLLYPDRTIQHAGLFPRTDGLWVHPYQGQPESLIHGHGELGFPRVVPAVTAACLLIRRTLFQSIGGFDEGFPVAYNDVDLCTRVRQRGLLIVVTPHAKLFHYEGLSRGYTVDKPEPVMG